MSTQIKFAKASLLAIFAGAAFNAAAANAVVVDAPINFGDVPSYSEPAPAAKPAPVQLTQTGGVDVADVPAFAEATAPAAQSTEVAIGGNTVNATR